MRRCAIRASSRSGGRRVLVRWKHPKLGFVPPSESGRASISVIDNGVGIAPENLARIFKHGFTTRASGHGFGLHSAVLAVRELGGSLSVHSEGLGRGATFTLELPLLSTQAGGEAQALRA